MHFSNKVNPDLVTVVIPVYNVENFVERCINSCVEQTYTNIEIICVNDCSNDNTKLIIDRFLCDNRVKCIENKINKGVFFSKHLGAKSANGKYLFFLDGDDYLEKDAIEKLVIVSNNSDIVAANMKLVDEKYQLLDRSITWEKFGEINADSFLTQATMLNRWSQCCMLIKKEIYDKISYLPFEVKIREDAIVLLQLCNYSGKVTVLNQTIYNYVQRKSSALNKSKTAYQRASEDYDYIINAYLLLKQLYNISFENRTLIKLNLVKEFSWTLVSDEIKAQHRLDISKIIRQILFDRHLLIYLFKKKGLRIFSYYLLTVLFPKFWVYAANIKYK